MTRLILALLLSAAATSALKLPDGTDGEYTGPKKGVPNGVGEIKTADGLIVTGEFIMGESKVLLHIVIPILRQYIRDSKKGKLSMNGLPLKASTRLGFTKK